MYLRIVTLPLLSATVSGLLGKKRGDHGASIATTISIFAAWLIACFIAYEVCFNAAPVSISLIPWISREISVVSWGFLFDSRTCLRLVVVLTISRLVHLYSISYIAIDAHLPRFIAYLSLFTFFILRLVTANNYVQRFVGWEGVGLCSYLLINFWFTRIQANKSAIKAITVNRIGDFGLSIALYLIYLTFGSLEYSTVFSLVSSHSNDIISLLNRKFNVIDTIGFFLFIGAVGKSAQLGLHIWLPDAIEGPTPVSALIHAATIVTAGVFILCRSSALLELAPNTSIVITVVGGRTAFIAASTGLVQNDLKRVIAYSTCSQLGYIVFSVGLSGYDVSIFHLYNHAFFKALLFLGAGSVIHSISDEQDIRKIGGLLRYLPVTYTAIVIGSLALRGFPFLAGFYSKDVILELAFGSFTVQGRFVYILGSIAAFLTAFYSWRLISLTYFGNNGYKVTYNAAHESDAAILFPLVSLSVLSRFIGYISRDLIIGLGTQFWGNSIIVLPHHTYVIEGEWLDISWKQLPLVLSICGAALSYYIYTYDMEFTEIITNRKLYTFLNRKWFFDKIYAEWVVAPIICIAYKNTYQNLDRGLLEFIGPSGIYSELTTFFDRIRNSIFFSPVKNILRDRYVALYSLLLIVVIVITVTSGFEIPLLSSSCLVVTLISLLVL